MHSDTINQELFWQHHTRFLNNNLVTETPNPKTHNLSQLCQTDLAQAFSLFKQVELEAISKLTKYGPDIECLQQSIAKVLSNNGKIFLMGCGASGRLTMLLKRLWGNYNPDMAQQVISISAAGDISLIKSVEQFEDNAEFGIQQLVTQGFRAHDLLIGLSASGESPFILAAVEYAAEHSQHKPYLIFNNPITSLVERSPKHIVTNSSIYPLELDAGPMALTGSTRLQATTVMQIALGIALCKPMADITTEINNIVNQISSFPLEKMLPVTASEADILNNHGYILYQTNEVLLGLSILADTTERSPTFNLPPYENINLKTAPYSPFYLNITGTNSSINAWTFLLGTNPTCLNWDNFPATKSSYINGFDLSVNSQRSQGNYLPEKQYVAQWIIKNNAAASPDDPTQQTGRHLMIQLKQQKITFNLPADQLAATILYKLCLNSHSTLMMGRLDYFFGNLMLSLRPSNFKLIDRAIRYSQFILEHQYGIILEYKKLADITFNEITKLQPNQSIVKNVVATAVIEKENICCN